MGKRIFILTAVMMLWLGGVLTVASAAPGGTAPPDDLPQPQHHAEVIAAECVVLEGGIGIRGTSASWLQTGAPGSGNPDVRILFDGVEVAQGAYTAANGFQFDFGPILVAGPGPVTVTALPVAAFDNGNFGDPRSVEVSLEECIPVETTLPPETTTTTSTSTTTTSTTVPPTTVTEPPPETTLPPVTEPPGTADVWADCLSPEAEFIHTQTVGQVFDLFIGVEWPIGTSYWFADIPTPPSSNEHQDWEVGLPFPTSDFRLYVVVGDEIVQDDIVAGCAVEPPVTTTTTTAAPPPDKGVCVEDDTSSTGSRIVGGPHDGEEALPCTGAADIPWEVIKLAGLGIIEVGAFSVLWAVWKRDEEELLG